MTVSIRKAFSEVMSEKYNKMNIAVFIFVIVLFTIVWSSFTGIMNAVNPLIAICLFPLYLLPSFVYFGYLAAAAHNNALGKNSVFPPVSPIGGIIIAGIKAYFGLLFWVIIMLLPGIIISFIVPIISKNIVLQCAAFLISLIWASLVFLKFYFPLKLIFLENLKFSSFFAFGKINSFLSARKGCYALLLIKSIILPIVIGIAFAVICMVLFGVIIISAFSGASAALGAGIIILILIVVITGFILNIIISLINTSLYAQFIKIGKVKKQKPQIKPISK